ncbi:MAG: protein translocase subunit SecF, partial [Zetaproteobacteria bacterium]|nr:protein translocase subunit SecF [Zetaproteobacteria bacterium]
MRIFKGKFDIDFMGKRTITMVLSGILLVIATGSLVVKGLNLGIDFTGGTLIEVGYPEPAELGVVRTALSNAGFELAQAQHFGTSRDVLIRIAPREGRGSAQLSEDVLAALRIQDASVEMRRVEFVGPQVGEELTEQGALA